MMNWGGDFGMGMMGGGIFMIIFWVLLILVVIYLIKFLAGGSSSGGAKPESPQDILKKRFARGEMSQKEFEEAIAVLRKNAD